MRIWSSLRFIPRRSCYAMNTSCVRTDTCEYTSAWQCMGYSEPGSADLTRELHFTQTRRVPLITRPDHLLIRVESASLNPVDVLCLSGYGASTFRYARYLGSSFGLMGLSGMNGSEFPFTPGRDFAGHVHDVAPSARFSPGDRVAGATWPFLSSTSAGSLAGFIVCPESYCARIPDNVSAIEACSIGYAGLTGWSALAAAGLHPFMSIKTATCPLVLVAGATGGVGLTAAQLAKFWGCRVHVTCPDDEKARSMMKDLEFDDVIVYPDLPPVGTKYDVIIDCIRPAHLSQNISQPTWNAEGILQIVTPRLPPLFEYLSCDSSARYVSLNSPVLYLMDTFGSIPGVGLAVTQRLSSQLLACTAPGGKSCAQLRWAFFKPSGERLDYMLKLVSTGLFKVFIDEIFPFDMVPEAFKRIASKGVRGKIVVHVND